MNLEILALKTILASDKTMILDLDREIIRMMILDLEMTSAAITMTLDLDLKMSQNRNKL